jgi:hypothetical protein
VGVVQCEHTQAHDISLLPSCPAPLSSPPPQLYPNQATGSFTITSPRSGTLTAVIVAGTNGTCGVPLCNSTGTIVANQVVMCRFNCSSSTTSLVPSFAVDGYNVTGASVPVTPIFVDGDTGCVTLTDPLWASNGIPKLAAAGKKICTTTTENLPTSTPAPDATQCLRCAASYTVNNTASIKTFGLGIPLGSSTATAVIPCKACTVTASISGTITRQWEWCARQKGGLTWAGRAP